MFEFEGLTKSRGVNRWDLTESHLRKLEEGFECVNVRQELAMMALKIETKAIDRIPTPQGMPRFITNWLQRTQKQNLRSPSRPPHQPRRSRADVFAEAVANTPMAQEMARAREASREPHRAPETHRENSMTDQQIYDAWVKGGL